MAFTGYFPWYWIVHQPTLTNTAGTVYIAGQCNDSTASDYLPPGVYYALSRNTTDPITNNGGVWFTVSGSPIGITSYFPMGNVKTTASPELGVSLDLYTASPPLTQVTVQNGSGATQTVFSVIYKYI